MLWALVLDGSGGTYILTSTPNDKFFGKFFHSRSIYFRRFWQKSADKTIAEEIFLTWDINPGFMSNKPTH